MMDLSTQEQNVSTPCERLTRRPEEVSRILGIGRNTVYELIRSGRLRSISIGRKILVPVTAIDEFLTAESQ